MVRMVEAPRKRSSERKRFVRFASGGRNAVGLGADMYSHHTNSDRNPLTILLFSTSSIRPLTNHWPRKPLPRLGMTLSSVSWSSASKVRIVMLNTSSCHLDNSILSGRRFSRHSGNSPLTTLRFLSSRITTRRSDFAGLTTTLPGSPHRPKIWNGGGIARSLPPSFSSSKASETSRWPPMPSLRSG